MTPPPVHLDVPLTGVRFDINVIDFCAEVTLHQRFENRETEPLEVVYEFVLEDNVSVSGFVADIEGKKITGVVQEKQKAKDTYDDSIASGGGAFLVEESEVKPNLFTVSIGNLPPMKETLISVSYVCTINTLPDGSLRFSLPGGPTNVPLQLSNPSVSTIYLKEVGESGVSIRASLDMSSPITSVVCHTHPIVVENGDKPSKAMAALTEATFASGKDFELLIQLAPSNEITSRVQQKEDGSKVAMLSFYPKLDGDVISECIFVVDRSGSMDGEPIQQVKETLQIFLRSLPEGTYFNIIGFGSSFMTLFPKESAIYNEKSLDTASKYVAKMAANLGGTNILEPLKSIFAKKPRPGVPRQVFLLTDGQISNTEVCISTVRSNANNTRVFTYGIGRDVDRDLVRGLAKAGNGECELIQDTESMNQKVLRLLNIALQPALTNVTLGWGSITGLKQTPFSFKPLFGGSSLVVYGFLPSGLSAPFPVVLKAVRSSGPVTSKLLVNPNEITPGTQIFKLAAKSLLMEVESGTSSLHSGGRKPTEQEIRAEELSISLKCQILCKYTAFIAVDKRADATEGTMQLREMKIRPVPSKNPQSVGRGGGRSGRGRGGGFLPCPSSTSSTSSTSSRQTASLKCKKMKKLEVSARSARNRAAPPPPPPAAAMMPRCFSSSGPSGSGGPPPPPPPQSASSSLMLKLARAPTAAYDSYEEKEEEEDEDEDEDEESESEDELEAESHECSEKGGAPPAPPSAKAMAKPRASSSSSTSSVSAAPTPKSAPSKLPEILMEQKANGSWPDTTLRLCEPLKLPAVTAALPSILSGKPEPVVVWITMVICCYIKSKFPDKKLEWNLIVNKATKWIEKQIGGSSSALEAAAQALLAM